MKIVFDKVTKSWGEIAALKDLSFKIKPGEFLFIVGPSGSGKTTILRLILSELKPSEGEIEVGDHSLTKAKKKQIDLNRRQIGVIFQDYRLIKDKTVRENIEIALDITGHPKKSWPELIEKAATRTEISNRLNFFPSQLSGGEKQRASLARSLAIAPRLILADEPTGNLDPKSAWQLMALLRKINTQDKTTIIMTTHNSDIVNNMHLRVIRLSEGKILSDKGRGSYPKE